MIDLFRYPSSIACYTKSSGAALGRPQNFWLRQVDAFCWEVLGIGREPAWRLTRRDRWEWRRRVGEATCPPWLINWYFHTSFSPIDIINPYSLHYILMIRASAFSLHSGISASLIILRTHDSITHFTLRFSSLDVFVSCIAVLLYQETKWIYVVNSSYCIFLHPTGIAANTHKHTSCQPLRPQITKTLIIMFQYTGPAYSISEVNE